MKTPIYHQIAAGIVFPAILLTSSPALIYGQKATNKKQGTITAAKKVSLKVPDSFRMDWVPPAVIKTPEKIELNNAPNLPAPDLKLKQSANPKRSDLASSSVLSKKIHFKGAESAVENVALQNLLLKLEGQSGVLNKTTANDIESFLQAYPQASVKVTLLLEQADCYWRHGYFQKGIASLEKAWESGKAWQAPEDRRYAEAALAKLLRLYAKIGRKDSLQKLMDEVKDRPLFGEANEALIKAHELQSFLINQAEQNIFCGFTAANTICVPRGKKPFFPDVHDEEEEKIFIREGLSAFELKAHSHENGGNLKIIKRKSGDAIPVPSVVHWSFGHYSAISGTKDGLYNINDAHLGFNNWVDATAINEQGSGVFLIPGDIAIPEGFSEVNDGEAKTIFGRHCNHSRSEEGGGGKTKCGSQKPMAAYSMSLLNPGLILEDTPISYKPAYGPTVDFKVTYRQRNPIYSSSSANNFFGPMWSSNFNSYVELRGSDTPNSLVWLTEGDGTYFEYSLPSSNVYSAKYGDRPVMEWITSSPTGFRLKYDDGSQKEFRQSASGAKTRYLLTKVIDPTGNSLLLTYTGSPARLDSIQDAVSQDIGGGNPLKTTLNYTPDSGDNATSTTLVRKITDPYGRITKFKYTTSGQLWKIIDPVGIVSEFQYGSGDFIKKLTTPYGDTIFETGDIPGIHYPTAGRYIQATDPEGQTERVESNDYATGITTQYYSPNNPPTSVTVNGNSVSFYPKNDNMNYRNTFHWTKNQWYKAPGDYSQATSYNWLAVSDQITDTLSSIKEPSEERVWFNYPGQSNASAPGTYQSPSKIMRRVEPSSGSTLVWTMQQREYDTSGYYGPLTQTTDELGRKTKLEYAANKIDLTAMKVDDSGTWRTLRTFGDHTSGHMPQTITEANGLVRDIDYNTRGQIVQITETKGGSSEVTKYTYDRANGAVTEGYLLKVEKTSPLNPVNYVTLVEYTYDSAKRVRTYKNPEGYVLTYDYDNIDRITLITHPDSTTEQWVYNRLDMVAQKNRNTEWIRFAYDGIGKMIYSQDPKGLLTSYEWCSCGNIRQLTDPKGNVTKWKRDNQGRVTEKILADGSKTTYSYQPYSGKLSTATYPNDQSAGPTVTYKWALDGKLVTEDYANSSTGDVTLAYNDYIGRLTSVTDASGSSSYSYVPFNGSNGAGLRYEINGPWSHDTIRYGYDWKNRKSQIESRNDSSTVLSSKSYTFDTLERITQSVNDLGTFVHTYNSGNWSPKVDNISLSGVLSTTYSHFGTSAGKDATMLQTIHHQKSGNSISKFDYTYDLAGRVKSWKQQLNPSSSAANTWTFNNTRAGELLDATLKNTGGTIIKNVAWNYDAAGNWNSHSEGTTSSYRQHNTTNQLTQVGGSGTTLVEGTLNEPAQVSVSVNSYEPEVATVTSIPGSGNFLFQKQVAVNAGSNTIAVTAKDAGLNETTNNYSLNLGSLQNSYEYDSNGNLRYVKNSSSAVIREYEWDTKNRLKAFVSSSHRTEWTYDGLDRRVRQVEKSGSVGSYTTVSDNRYLWVDQTMIQERDSTGATVTKNFYDEGEEWTGGGTAGDYIYTKDHLGSIREVLDSTGAVRNRYDYDMFGKRTSIGAISGESRDREASFGFTSHYEHSASGLTLALYRGYDSTLGRWLSRDLIGENGGLNLYGYVHNNPINSWDSFGLSGAAAAALRLPQIWTGAFIEPSPVGEAVAATITVGIGIWWLWDKCTEDDDDVPEYRPTTRDKKPDEMGGEDDDFLKGKGPKRGTPEYEKLRRLREKDKNGEGRGGNGNPEGPFELP